VSTIGVLAASLNATVDDAVDEDFTADFLVQSTNFLPFSTKVGDAVAQVDGVGTVSRQQWVGATVDDGSRGGGDHTEVAGNDNGFDEIYSLDMLAGTQEVSGNQAVVQQDLADEQDLAVGDTLELRFPAGRSLSVEVAGIAAASEVTAPVSVSLDALTGAGITRQDTSISILLEPGADPEVVHDELDEAVEVVPIVGVFDKEEFAESIRAQVNQLLYIIYGLLALAIVIAVFGIVNTLSLSVFERTREIGLLRAVGMSRARLRRMITLESVTIAVLGAILGMALGLLIGVLLREALEDDLTSLGLPLGQVAAFLVTAVVVGVLAAVIPAVRASRLNVLDAIATE
jgi:putative ABC transport system permease protein